MPNHGVKVIKRENSRVLLRLVKERGGISRAELAKITRLGKATVSTLTQELIQKKFLRETGKGTSSGGKPPTILEFQPDAAYGIGIDISTEKKIRFILCNLHSQILVKREMDTGFKYETLLADMEKGIKEILAAFPVKKIRGIGVAASGIVDPRENEILASTHFDYARRNMAGHLKKKFGLPVFLENVMNASAWFEKRHGQLPMIRNLIYISAQRGVGAGIILEEKIYYGNHLGAGQIGNLIVYPEAGRTDYDFSETLEERLSEAALMNEIKQVCGPDVTLQEALMRYRAGDANAVLVFQRSAETLALAVAAVANFFNPAMVVLGGRIRDFGETYLKDFTRVFSKRLLPMFVGEIRIFLSDYGPEIGSLGGAEIVIEKVLNLELV